MKRIGCLHAHHSNISFIDQTLVSYEVEFSLDIDDNHAELDQPR